MNEVNRNQTKRGKKIMTVVAILLGGILCLNLIGFAINRIFFSNELAAIEPYGQMVNVDGKKMHVYSLGSGEKTIVLLPGFGVALPAADFGPLMRELAKEYTVVLVEYFGTGFSDATDSPRTNENLTREIRSALSLAGFQPPYILMPHSVSGVYSEFYAATYPGEISAIVMLDTTSTGKIVSGNPPRIAYQIGMLQQETGLTRLTAGLVPPAQKIENGYTEKEIGDYKLFGYHVLNQTMIDQSFGTLTAINDVNTIPFPEEIPVLKLISSQSLQKVGQDYETSHLKRLGDRVESIVIEGTHFIYQTRTEEIHAATDAFLDKYRLTGAGN